MKRPNILLITTDQHRADMLGCYGNPVIRTPHLDRLASEGARFDCAYVTNPLCMPSRASIMTGRFPSQHGVWVNGIPLREDLPTLPGVLAAHGYQTAAFGKLHLTPYGAPGFRESVPDWEQQPYGDWHGPYYGFDEVHLTLYHNSPSGHYGEWLRERHPEAIDQFWAIEGRRSPSAPPATWTSAVPVEAHHSTWVGDLTVDFLRRRPRDRPFFAWASFPDPHHPFCPPEPYASMYDPADVTLPPRRPGDLADKPPQYRAWYEEGVRHEGSGGKGVVPANLTEQQWREMAAYNYGQVTLVDENIGRILAELDRQGLTEETIVLFTADHGELLGEHGLLYKGPFLFEGLLRVPLIVRWPGRTPAALTSQALISLADLMPTLLEAAGVPAPEGMQGRSFLPALTGPAAEHRDAVLTEFHSAYFPGLNLRTLRTREFKLTFYPGRPYGELYDLRSDPHEFVNRWDDPAYAAVKSELLHRLLHEVLSLEADDPRPLAHA